MKHAIVLTFAAAMMLLVPRAHAVTDARLKQLVQKTWYGASVQPANFTKNGKAYLGQRFEFNFVSATHFKGKAYTSFKLDGVTYRSTYEVSGHISGRNKTVTFRTGRMLRSDRLPHGLSWCGSNGTLTIYREKGHAGHYLLKGPVRDTCGGSSKLELGTRYRSNR